MPTSYSEQFFLMDPANPPAVGTPLNFVNYTLTDQNDDDDFDRFDNDSVNGSDIQSSWPGDTITVNVAGVGDVTYTGTTFYLANGQRVFTPTDGQVLQNGIFVSSSFVTTQGPLLVNELGPPCFTPGTLIRVPAGDVRIETLEVGDLVETLDHGPQELRWIGRKAMAGAGNLVPIRISSGTLGNERDLVVSQQHRILVTGWRAELYFGEPEVLVAAKHLASLDSVNLEPPGRVEYVHLLFDRHELIFSEGIPTESFHPGSFMLDEDPELLEEIARIFPEIVEQAWRENAETARPVLKAYEARVLTF